MGKRCPVPGMQREQSPQDEEGTDRGRGGVRDTPGTTSPEEDRLLPVGSQTVDRCEGEERGEGVNSIIAERPGRIGGTCMKFSSLAMIEQRFMIE